MDYIIINPSTKEEYASYFNLRYQLLRAPWNQPQGSEKDDQEDSSIHFLMKKNGNPIGVCRLQKNNEFEFQVRYMAIHDAEQGKGLGKVLLKHAEEKSIILGGKYLILQAREEAIGFYKNCGYEIIEKSYFMWEKIQHFLMKKILVAQKEDQGN